MSRLYHKYNEKANLTNDPYYWSPTTIRNILLNEGYTELLTRRYFSNEKITFVFAVNMEQLQHTIKHHYGDEFNAYKYLDRFFDLIIPMPKLNPDTFFATLPYDPSTIVYEVDCDGEGKNAMDVVDAAIEKKSKAEENIPYDCVWAVFDKDDFEEMKYNKS